MIKKPLIKPLHPQFLRKKLRPPDLGFETTKELKSLTEFFGQDRALEALKFGISIDSLGYNLYVMGPVGMGKRSLISSVLAEHATKIPVPPDWCYLYNFDFPEKPIAVSFPAGEGLIFQHQMKMLIEKLLYKILTFYESRTYHLQIKKITYAKRKKGQVLKKNKNDFEVRNKEEALQLKSINNILKPMIKRLRKKYVKYPTIVNYLKSVQKDLLTHGNDFIKQDNKSKKFIYSLENPMLIRYKVNLIVDNSELKGAPVVFEDMPSYSTMVCRIEHASQSGILTTNFMLIKPGSLHRANGGYLIIEANKLKKNVATWEALKNILYAKEIKIKSIQHEEDSIKPVSLDPMPIPLDIKIILLGDRNTYYSLCQHDPNFIELFKVPVDFNEEIERNKKNIHLYARLIATIAKREKLKIFHASAVAAIIDYSTRLVEDVSKLSTHMHNIEDLVLEANYWEKNKRIVKASAVKKAIDAQNQRMGRARDLYYEDIQRDFILIKTSGKLIGQVNCLSVRRVGNFSYGHPTRVSARIRLGKGKIIDIQREIKMAGPMHSKAGLIISNFLTSCFEGYQPFSLVGSVSFEQVYCMTEGDSASVGELCALFSALAEVPIFQHLAVTGSIDQYGMVQSIGGVNEKIEGFYDVCKKRGLSGKQGVLIPTINQKNLMLREDIVEAAQQKKFFIYTINHVEDAVFLLMGLPFRKKGNKDSDSNTIYTRIVNRLQNNEKLYNSDFDYKDKNDQ